jgi:hypothetical protein
MVKGWEWFSSLAALVPASPPLNDAGSHDSCATGVCMLSWAHGSSQDFPPLRRARSALIGVKEIIWIPDETDINEQEWLQAAASNPAFDFLKEPDEDIYTLTDGKPFYDQG